MTTESQEFWRTLLAELPPLRFSQESPGVSSSTCTNERIVIEHLLDSVQTRPLKAFAEKHGMAFSSLLLAVHVKVLSMQIQEGGFVTGIKINAAVEDNPLPLVFDAVNHHENWSDLARHISLLEESSRRHSEDMTLENIEALCPRNQLFDTLFSFNQSLPEKPPENLQGALEAAIYALWQALLPGAEFSVDDGFFDAGGNSLLLIRLHEKLETNWPGVFSVARLFSVTTIAAQARSIQEKHEKRARNLTLTTQDRVKKTPSHIAIVGIGVRLPGSATLESCWQDVANGVDKVSPMPEDRCKESLSMLNALGGIIPEQFQEAAWLEQIFNFDPERFRLSPADAALVHPEQRLFLETALMALEDAGYGGKSLDNKKIGTFAATSHGTLWTDYALRVLPERAEQLFINNVPSNVATRLSFLHNWRGPATLVDTACSSALTAVHLACQSLISGECTAALAGGARLMMIPHSSAARFTIESSTARTHAFDESADGTGSGEGSVVFLLKTLEQAEADGDPVHAVILGTAINQDGASTGMAAPNPAAQSEVITAAAAKAGVPLSTISYIEAHGTGTHLGDPVEIEGIRLAFSRETSETGFALIGSGKGNYGHLDACAGALGLLRAVLCLKNDQAPPQPFFSNPNPRIDFANSPVNVCRQLVSLPDRGTPRRAGVSSFGLSGINVHAIIEAPPPVISKPVPLNSGWMVIGLSAATPVLLHTYAAALAEQIRENPACALADIAYTLNTGRDSLSERLVFWFRNHKELLGTLETFLCGTKAEKSLTGRLGRQQRSLSAAQISSLATDEPSARMAAQAFLDGGQLIMPQAQHVKRVHLATTPLQRITCRPLKDGHELQREIRPTDHRLPIDTPEGLRYRLDVHSPSFWPAAEHLLAGVPTLVGMGVLPLLAIARKGVGMREETFSAFSIKELFWLRPLQTPQLKPGSVSLLLAEHDAAVHHATLGGRMLDGSWKNFAEATLGDLGAIPPEIVLDAEHVRQRMRELLPSADRTGSPDGDIQVSARWNCLRAKKEKGNEVFAHLELPCFDQDQNLQKLHPGLLDSAVSMVLDRPGLLPAACAEILVCLPLPANVFARAVRTPMPDGGIKADVQLYDMESGALCIAFRELRFILPVNRAMQQKEAMKVPVVPSSPLWIPDPVAQTVSAHFQLVVIGEGELYRRLADHPLAKASILASCGSYALTDEVVTAIAEGAAGRILLIPAPGEDIGLRTVTILRTIAANLRQPLQLLAAGRGAYSLEADHSTSLPMPDTALMAGLVMVAAREESMLSTRYLELDADAPIDALFQEFHAFNNHPQAPVFLDHSGRRLIRTFVPLPAIPLSSAMVWPTSGCCVVSGGTGGLALLLAGELALGGAVSLALLSRHPPAPGDDPESRKRFELFEALAEKGITVHHWCVDVSDLQKLSEVLDDVRSTLGPIRAVVHNAGLGDSRLLVNETPELFSQSTAPKVAGARNLDLLTRNDPLQAFVLSGSLTAIESRAGTGAYAAANLFLDAFADWRRREGRPTLAINWCQIGEIGMAARILDGKFEEYSLTPEEVLLHWRRALASGAPQVALLYDDKAENKTASIPASSVQSKTMEKALAEIWAEILGYDEIEFDDDFYALGGDSMSGIDIIDRIIKDLGHPVTFTNLVESGTVSMLAERLRRHSEDANSPANSRNIQFPSSAPVKSRYPLNWEQMALIRAQMAAENSIAYNLPNLLSLPQNCNADRLASAIDSLTRRHEILRTRFHFKESEPEMEILSDLRMQLKSICPTNGITADFCRNWIRPFDLEAAPPVRFELIEKPDGTPEALLFDIHHSLADGLSLELLASDLGALYAGKNLPPLALQLKDYAWWSRKGAGIEAVESAKLYWLDRFSLPLPVLDLPSDRPRPAFHTWQCGSFAFSLPQKSVEALRRYAATHSTTPFTVILSAWAALLSRYCRSEDLVISVPVDARESLGATGVPGMMVSLLPLRFFFNDNDSVESFIRGVHTDLADAMRHRACPLGMLLEALSPPAAPERTLLSEVTLSYMNYAESKGGSLDNKEAFRLTGIERGNGKNDISIFMRDLPDQISVVCEYYSAMYDQERIERMGEHFTVLLDALLESHTDTKLSMLPLLTVEEECWLEGAGNAMNDQLQSRGNLFAHFAATVKQHNNSIAVSDNLERLSYNDLLYRAGGIAQYLTESGIGEGDIVAMYIERSCNAVATILGINAVGACYLPLDPSYPPRRIAWILADAQCRAVIADAAGRKALAEASLIETDEAGCSAKGEVPIKYVTIDAEKMALLCTPPPETERRDDLLAYLMYTSGSTGLPKGVRIFEHSIIRLVMYDNYITFKPIDRILQVASFAFDLSTYDLWGALLSGSQLFISDRNDILDPAALAEKLKRLNISVIAMPTGLFHRQAELLPESFSTLRAVIAGGEAMSAELMRRVMKASPETEFFNGYGPTENTTFTTVHKICHQDLKKESLPIGRPVPQTIVRVLDKNNQRVPIGIWGEIVTGGEGIADGYLNRPELTVERFFYGADDINYYRTGDLGRWRQDGVLEFSGRKDGQIKLRGFRIEPGEIEEALLQHPSVAGAAVLFRREAGELIACLLARDEALEATELRSWLMHRIPSYMVPARFIRLTHLPVNSNGKLDRIQLNLEADNGEIISDSNATSGGLPSGETELMVAEVFSEIFQHPVEDRNLSFLDLGGHSLIIIKAINRIAQRSGIRLTINDFFATPTVTGLASCIEASKHNDAEEFRIPRAPDTAFPFASHAEERLYLVNTLDATAAAYNMTFFFRAGIEFIPEALRQAILSLVDRHESLRTGFEECDGEIIRRIEKTESITLSWQEDDLSMLSDPFTEALRLTRTEVSRPFNLSRPPLLRVRLIRTGEEQTLILILTHHIVHDGWSSRIFLRELELAYKAALLAKRATFPPLPITVRDYAVWQHTRDWSDTAIWWKNTLEGAPERIELPCDRPLPEIRSNKGATLKKELPQETAKALQQIALHKGVSMAALGLTLFSALLFRLTRQNELVIGMGVAGRDRAELEGLIGFFVNVLPIRIKLDQESEFDTLLTLVHKRLMEALDHRDYPFDCLIRDLAPKRAGNRQPLINVVFEYQRFEPVNTALIFPPAPDISASFARSLDEVIYPKTAKHDLLLFYVEQEENTELMIEYDTDILDTLTIERWLSYFIQLASHLCIENSAAAGSGSEKP
jgi:amino acid adenylation domain-containing protein